jgi:hypothetical protein
MQLSINFELAKTNNTQIKLKEEQKETVRQIVIYVYFSYFSYFTPPPLKRLFCQDCNSDFCFKGGGGGKHSTLRYLQLETIKIVKL